MRPVISLIAFLFFSLCIAAQEINIIPQPASIKQPRIAANFSITPATQIVLEGSNLQKTADFLNTYLQQFYLFKLKVVKKATSKNVIVLNYDRLDNEIAGAYQLTVDGKGVYIGGDNEQGVFYGAQTLIQLLPVPDARLKMRPNKLEIPYVSIEDAPRFDYRGMMLDVSRHFFPVSFVKKYIDYLALHKFNKFHWHLTDDQGWRIEIKKYPKLTAVGAWRNGTIIGRYPGKGNDNQQHGGFYTQAEVKEIVKYAAARYIDIIPEIEMPGHASAAIAAYPELSCFPDEPTITYFPKESVWAGDSTGKQVQQSWGVYDDVFVPSDNTFTFLENVLSEVMPLFPSQYIHIGGDECPKTNWKRSAFCQQLIKEKGLKDEHGLQSYFIQRIEKYINSKGKKIIGWDEILEGGLAPNAAVMSWRGEEGGIEAAKQSHNVVMTPGGWLYLDHSQSENEDSVTIGGYTTVQKTYSYEPLPAALNANQAKYILGAQANLWTEYIKYPSKVEYMVFPRMSALSEVVWSPKEKKNWNDFEQRLQTQFKRYDLWRANYSKAYFDLKQTVAPTDNFSGVTWKIATAQPNADLRTKEFDPNTSLVIRPEEGLKYTQPVLISKSTVMSGWNLANGRLIGNPVSQRFYFNKATGKKITLNTVPSKSYPGDGAFTLVNGIQNEAGLARSKEFLGFEGGNCEMIIDLGAETEINEIIIHTYEQTGSWIYFPGGVDIAQSADGQTFAPFQSAVSITKSADKTKASIQLASPVKTRYLKINVLNFGTIPDGMAGAGHKAWLFVDEVEIK